MGELESIEDVIAHALDGRCANCLRFMATDDDWENTEEGERPDLCWEPNVYSCCWVAETSRESLVADAIRAHLAEVAGRDDVREAMAKAVLADAFAKDRTAVTWEEADHEWLRDDADAAVGAYLQAIGDQQ